MLSFQAYRLAGTSLIHNCTEISKCKHNFLLIKLRVNMTNKLHLLEQIVRDHNVIRTKISGQGNGLVAARDISPPNQLLFVRQPLMVALDNARLQDTCYQCLRPSVSEQSHFLPRGSEDLNLKACTGCQIVKFCDRTCQKLAWSRYHKHECKIYGKLYPRVLPSSTRAIIRLLLERGNKLVSEEEWQQIFTLQTHQDDLSKGNEERWQNLCLMAKAVHSYSGTDESLDTVLKLCCILTVNSFTLTNTVYEPIGVILHPLPALINHSCSPNAYIRFDTVPPPPPPGAIVTRPDRLPHTTISIHALEPIKSGSEIFVPYIDVTIPRSNRQSELSSQYFFTCSCSLCAQGSEAITDAFLPRPSSPPTMEIEQAELVAHFALSGCESSSNNSLSLRERIAQIKYALSCLAKTQRWPVHRYPGPQLRRHLLLLQMATGLPGDVFYQALLKSRIDDTLYPSKHHPMRITTSWMLYQLARLTLINISDNSPKFEEEWWADPGQNEVQRLAKRLAALMCLTLDDLCERVLPPEYHNPRPSGPVTAERQATWEKTAKRMDLPLDLAANEQPPPYIGPEVPPEGLPDYPVAVDQSGNDYLASKTGDLEMKIGTAMIKLETGDESMFWADFMEGRLPSKEEIEAWMDSQIQGLLLREERYQDTIQ